jgi:hypothetical protein
MNNNDRQFSIEIYSRNGDLEELKYLLTDKYTQLEIDIALESAVAYSQTKTAIYLIELGAKFSNYNFQGVYYAIHNNQLEGLKFAIENGVDININNGMPINVSTITSINSKSSKIFRWLLENGANINLLSAENLKLVNQYANNELRSLVDTKRKVLNDK